MQPSNVLILGASYGSLLATRLLMAGHRVTLVCTRGTAELINRDGTLVRFPVKGRGELVAVDSRALPGQLTAATPEQVVPAAYDLVVLGMQEAQYGADGVRQLMARVAAARKPCLAIMNMPPLPYLQRVPGLDTAALRACYTDPAVWDGFDPALVSLASPDPQAFRPPEQPKNVLQVGLPTNFKAARFEAPAHTDLLRRLESDIEQARFSVDGEPLQLPVKLKVHDSLFVPLAKWPMLVTGNYRCIQADGMRSIRDAVHGDLEHARRIYQWVVDLCTRLGAAPEDLVPFDKYAQAAASLLKPSSAARALFGGATDIERVDKLVQLIARQLGQPSTFVDDTVRLVDER
ncbi:MAG: ketopantoate reductase family protein, partial [Ramlibacter sp.]